MHFIISPPYKMAIECLACEAPRRMQHIVSDASSPTPWIGTLHPKEQHSNNTSPGGTVSAVSLSMVTATPLTEEEA